MMITKGLDYSYGTDAGRVVLPYAFSFDCFFCKFFCVMKNYNRIISKTAMRNSSMVL